jgi:hypothetical protein
VSVPPEFAGLVDGVVLALVLIAITWALARVLPEIWIRALLAAVLVVAAAVYVVFAADEGGGWVAGELVGVALYGGLAVLGLRGSRWWLVAGWTAHPVWDMALHYAGPGRAFAPDTYTIPCLSFDLLVAVYIAWAGRSWPSERARRSRRTRDLAAATSR